MQILWDSWKIRTLPVLLANEEVKTEEVQLPGNEFSVGQDDWVELQKYGDFTHGDGTQRFLQEDAQNLVNEFNSLLSTPQRMLGLPWYIGHPDHPKFKDRYTDTKSYGRIKGLDARKEGLFANVKWSPAGEDLIRSEAFHGHSLNWGARKIGGVWRPCRLKSVGFTNEPNIPVTPITLANEAYESMKPKLVAALGLPADATDEQVLAAVELANEAKQRADQAVIDKTNAEVAKTTAETSLANETSLKTAAETAKATAESARALAETAKANTETALANERSARIDLLLDGAIRDGRVTAADRQQWKTELTGNFDTKVVELANAKPLLKTAARTRDLGQRKEVSAASDKVVELCNERMAKHGEEWPVAWAAVKKENPALFDQMQTPGKTE